MEFKGICVGVIGMSTAEFGDSIPIEILEILERHYKTKEEEYKYYGGLFKKQALLLYSPYAKKNTDLNSLFPLPFDEKSSVKEKPKKMTNDNFMKLQQSMRHNGRKKESS